MSALIYIVDDDDNIRNIIKKYLLRSGYRVKSFNNGTNFLMEFNQRNPDLIILDIMLPDCDGYDLCRNIRKESDIPIIFVSAKDEEFDKILGLELGGDDYLSKPFSPRELVTRVKTILRRIKPNEEKINPVDDKIILKNVTIYPNMRKVTVGKSEINLTSKEYDLFTFLCNNKNIAFNREDLMKKIWGYDYICESRTIDDLIKRLRKNLKTNEAEVNIKTIWGYGYIIED